MAENSHKSDKGNITDLFFPTSWAYPQIFRSSITQLWDNGIVPPKLPHIEVSIVETNMLRNIEPEGWKVPGPGKFDSVTDVKDLFTIKVRQPHDKTKGKNQVSDQKLFVLSYNGCVRCEELSSMPNEITIPMAEVSEHNDKIMTWFTANGSTYRNHP